MPTLPITCMISAEPWLLRPNKSGQKGPKGRSNHAAQGRKARPPEAWAENAWGQDLAGHSQGTGYGMIIEMVYSSYEVVCSMG
jgi:hypothetical protein